MNTSNHAAFRECAKGAGSTCENTVLEVSVEPWRFNEDPSLKEGRWVCKSG
jgi:hypothetical protein